ncbi:hypothetical protein Z043_101385, partial [Scleropages formosus]
RRLSGCAVSKEETLALRKEGIGVVLDSELPHLIGIDDDLLSTGIILYHLKEGRTYVGLLHGLDLESEHCVFENLSGTVTLIPLNGAQCSVNGIHVVAPCQLNQGAVILLGRTNMFRFNHPSEAAKLREKRKSGLLSSFSLSMTDLSKSCENLSAVMLYNPGLEFERQQREELEKLENKRRLIKEMEEKQRYEKAELERIQQEVESQRKESEQVQLRIRRQEESLKRRSQDIESRLRDLLAEKERFEEERLREQQELELRSRRHEEERLSFTQEEQEHLREAHRKERAEKMEIFCELEKLRRERDEQAVRMELEKRRLEEQEREQRNLVARLEEQLREKQESVGLLRTDDVQRAEQERAVLQGIRGALLKAKEARPDGDEEHAEVRSAKASYVDFKVAQLEQLKGLQAGLLRQKERLEADVLGERKALNAILHAHEEHQRQLRELPELGSSNASQLAQEKERIWQAEQWLRYKERQLERLTQTRLPAVAEERQRVAELLERGPPGLDNALYQVEKEIEEKEEQLSLYCASADQLQQLRDTYEFTANVARQEEKVRRKEKEILESREKQQREALEEAVARLERRHSALRRSSALELEIEEQRRKLSGLGTPHTSLEAEHQALEQDRERLEQEIQQLKQRIRESEGGHRSRHSSGDEKPVLGSSPVSPGHSLPGVLPITDDRINAYIEEEVQRRLHKLNLLNGDHSIEVPLSSDTAKPKWTILSAQTEQQDENQSGPTDSRKMKYEQRAESVLQPSFLFAPGAESAVALGGDMGQSVRQQEAPRCLNEPHRWGATHHGTEPGAQKGTEVHEEGADLLLHKSSGHGAVAEVCWDGPAAQAYGADGSNCKDLRALRAPDNESRGITMDDSAPAGTLLCGVPCLQLARPSAEDTTTGGGEHQRVKGRSEPEVQECSSFCGPVRNAEGGVVSLHSQFGPAVVSKGLGTISEVQLLTRELKVGYFGLGSLVSRLSCVYRDAHRVLRQVRDRDFQLASGWYNHMCAAIKELSFPQHIQPEMSFEADVRERGTHFSEVPTVTHPLIEDFVGKLGSSCSSVATYQRDGVEVFCQRLVEFPPGLQKLQSLPLRELRACLCSVVPPHVFVAELLLAAFWLRVARCSEPTPQPALLVLFESVLYALTSDPELSSEQFSLAVLHELPLQQLKEIDVGFGGQSVRLLGPTEGSVLAVYTNSKELSQALCRSLVEALSPDAGNSGYLEHPLLQEDLLQLSLDWKAENPDLVLEDGRRLGCHFKKVLADLIYFVYGSMGKEQASMADIQLLLYTGVKVAVTPQWQPRTLCQFLLTETHMGLVEEDALFHPVPRHLALVPQQAHFQGMTLRRRSDIRCILAASSSPSTTVEIVFTTSHPELAVAAVPSVPWSNLSSHSERLMSRPLETTSEDVKDAVKISIPRYVLRGQGKDEHYEFEVKITVLDETWAVFRRYSRFREMHRTLRLKYPEVFCLAKGVGSPGYSDPGVFSLFRDLWTAKTRSPSLLRLPSGFRSEMLLRVANNEEFSSLCVRKRRVLVTVLREEGVPFEQEGMLCIDDRLVSVESCCGPISLEQRDKLPFNMSKNGNAPPTPARGSSMTALIKPLKLSVTAGIAVMVIGSGASSSNSLGKFPESTLAPSGSHRTCLNEHLLSSHWRSRKAGLRTAPGTSLPIIEAIFSSGVFQTLLIPLQSSSQLRGMQPEQNLGRRSAPSLLASLEFPPKKLFGNRDERVVAERRGHLEVCSAFLATTPELKVLAAGDSPGPCVLLLSDAKSLKESWSSVAVSHSSIVGLATTKNGVFSQCQEGRLSER